MCFYHERDHLQTFSMHYFRQWLQQRSQKQFQVGYYHYPLVCDKIVHKMSHLKRNISGNESTNMSNAKPNTKKKYSIHIDGSMMNKVKVTKTNWRKANKIVFSNLRNVLSLTNSCFIAHVKQSQCMNKGLNVYILIQRCLSKRYFFRGNFFINFRSNQIRMCC